jgi:hypothetical protein
MYTIDKIELSQDRENFVVTMTNLNSEDGIILEIPVVVSRYQGGREVTGVTRFSKVTVVVSRYREDSEDRVRVIFPDEELPSYEYIIPGGIFFSVNSLEKMKSKYDVDMSSRVNFVISYMKYDFKIGEIYRLSCPIRIENNIGGNHYVAYEGGSSDEFIFEITDDMFKTVYDVDGNSKLREFVITKEPDYVFTASPQEIYLGRIGYIVRYKGLTEVITKAGFIRMIRLFEVLGGNEYS